MPTTTLQTTSDGFARAIRNDAIDIAALVGLSTTVNLTRGALLVGGHTLKTACSAGHVAAAQTATDVAAAVQGIARVGAWVFTPTLSQFVGTKLGKACVTAIALVGLPTPQNRTGCLLVRRTTTRDASLAAVRIVASAHAGKHFTAIQKGSRVGVLPRTQGPGLSAALPHAASFTAVVLVAADQGLPKRRRLFWLDTAHAPRDARAVVTTLPGASHGIDAVQTSSRSGIGIDLPCVA